MSTDPSPTLDVLADRKLQELLGQGPEVPRSRQVFVNRNLKMSGIELVGFDMDYTVARYAKRSIEQLSFDMTLDRMVRKRGWPESLRSLTYDHDFVMRGLALDRATGNMLKMDRYRYVGRGYHGRSLLESEEKRRLYRGDKIDLKSVRFAWIDTLFALPEACLYAAVIEALEAAGQKVDFDRLYVDIRECIDEVHRDDSLKAVIRQDLARFVLPDPELGPTLHKLRSGGKKLFLLTNSGWDFTDVVMRFLLDGKLAEYPSWRHYFDVVVAAARKPGFFTEGSPFVEVDPATGQVVGEARTLERGKVYHGGNLADFERLVGIGGEKVLYVGDHIYGDILKSKKTTLWRTCLVIEELEDEIAYTEEHGPELSRLAALEALRGQLDEEINSRKLVLAALEKRLAAKERPEGDPAEEQRRRQKSDLERLRRALRQAAEEIEALETHVENGFNPYWGLMFKEGTEHSRFGEQVDRYACIYTSRVSNLLAYSPMQYFRSPRDSMPHERNR